MLNIHLNQLGLLNTYTLLHIKVDIIYELYTMYNVYSLFFLFLHILRKYGYFCLKLTSKNNSRIIFLTYLDETKCS